MSIGAFDEIKFQLTPPMWVATEYFGVYFWFQKYFNSHHPCGWRPVPDADDQASVNISTHTTHVGGDDRVGNIGSCHPRFQLTPPMWVATRSVSKWQILMVFQLTPPMWVATTVTR